MQPEKHRDRSIGAALPMPLSSAPQCQLHPVFELLREFIDTSRLERQGWVEIPDTGGAEPAGSLFILQLTMGRLGQVVEDKKCIQLKDLTSVSPGKEEEKGEGKTPCSGSRVFGMGWPRNGETRPTDFGASHPHTIGGCGVW